MGGTGDDANLIHSGLIQKIKTYKEEKISIAQELFLYYYYYYFDKKNKSTNNTKVLKQNKSTAKVLLTVLLTVKQKNAVFIWDEQC